ncbi:hypothetical protein SERLADRAFT_455173 [Serpula lacrymans var. lacrymans S7.9]|uniref:Urease accessory protein UreD n=1 Tax=Serpula lacrymans var. lacrymans (strain S7.9) TaxID=578457 RepID=F8NFT3_SERL9|nr:uncharacterized protein SERLADRAFT_455173 [Serpula lacrymans var. lacrymans S7.9]EGO30903.1 hypothetical protein SERLADRAFT_455173 [Serpula lacrymans var. lacrymans S7.9]
MRQGERSSIVLRGSSSVQQVTTTQSMDVTVSAQGAIFVLPDPVTCFRSASYNQIQTFRLVGDASIVLLDWVTSGRRYYSLNKVIVDGKPIARDVLLLEQVQAQVPADDTPRRSLKDRLSPYSCYAMLLLYGPLTRGVIAEMTTQYEAITVFNMTSPQPVIWSLSPICGGAGCVVRTAGVETEDVKNWLKNALRGLENVIGVDVYRKAFL